MDPRLSVSPRIDRSNIRTPQDIQCVYNEQGIGEGNAGVNSTNG